MIRRHLAPTLVLAVVMLLLSGRWSSGSVSGNGDPTITFHGWVRTADNKEQYHFIIDVEPNAFRLTNVAGKYKLARLRVENSTAAPLALSADHDQVELVQTGGPAVAAVLNLQSGDSTYWDGLNARTRELLAYPVSVTGTPAPTGGAPLRAPQALYIYLFFPQGAIADVPTSFTYRVASLGQTIKLERSAPKAS